MSKQSTAIQRNDYENKILDLEKKYFEIIKNIVMHDDFKKDLALIEKEISDNYTKFDDLWNLKNKIKVPAERVVRHHLYVKMVDLIKGIFPSPLSSDFGIRTDDAVVCIDIKTIDTNGNDGDLRATSVEKNQTSFDNKNYPYINIPANLNAVDDYSRLPVLTYVVKIVYTDNGYSFKLSRDEYPSMVLVCVPNGKIAKLFDYNIVANCKTYDYYNVRNDGVDFAPIELTPEEKDDIDIIDQKCHARGLTRLSEFRKPTYYDSKTRSIWWKTSFANKHVIAPVKSGSSVRFSNDILKERYDSRNHPWEGYIEWNIPKQ